MITFKKLLERAKTKSIAVHTPTEEQAISLLNELDKKGFTWVSGEKLTTKTCYEVESTCYNFEPNKKIMYSQLDYYQDEGYTIIEFSEIDFEEE